MLGHHTGISRISGPQRDLSLVYSNCTSKVPLRYFRPQNPKISLAPSARKRKSRSFWKIFFEKYFSKHIFEKYIFLRSNFQKHISWIVLKTMFQKIFFKTIYKTFSKMNFRGETQRHWFKFFWKIFFEKCFIEKYFLKNIFWKIFVLKNDFLIFFGNVL